MERLASMTVEEICHWLTDQEIASTIVESFEGIYGISVWVYIFMHIYEMFVGEHLLEFYYRK